MGEHDRFDVSPYQAPGDIFVTVIAVRTICYTFYMPTFMVISIVIMLLIMVIILVNDTMVNVYHFSYFTMNINMAMIMAICS